MVIRKQPQKPQQPEDKQKKYLIEKFGSLMERVSDGYGGPLQEELIRRLERTISEFHDEVSDLIVTLKEESEKRQEKLKALLENREEETPPPEDESSEESEAAREISDWERRIEEKQDQVLADEKEDEPDKKAKGFFGRKKK